MKSITFTWKWQTLWWWLSFRIYLKCLSRLLMQLNTNCSFKWKMRLYNIIYIINMPMTPWTQMIKFIYFHQIILDNISFVKVKIVRPKHQNWNPKQNAQSFRGTSIIHIIILTYKCPKEVPHNVLSPFPWILTLNNKWQLKIKWQNLGHKPWLCCNSGLSIRKYDEFFFEKSIHCVIRTIFFLSMVMYKLMQIQL